MVLIDPIADMLTRIRNAHGAFHSEVSIPASKIKESIAGIMKEEGYITDFEVADSNISIALKYKNGKSLIAGIRKISKPGLRVYVGVEDIPRVQNGLGICILSTSKGLLEGSQASADNIGGELLCEIW